MIFYSLVWHLTHTNKILYKNTRDKTKAKNYQFTWIRDGKIFVRKDILSPKIFIKNGDDLQRIILFLPFFNFIH